MACGRAANERLAGFRPYPATERVLASWGSQEWIVIFFYLPDPLSPVWGISRYNIVEEYLSFFTHKGAMITPTTLALVALGLTTGNFLWQAIIWAGTPDWETAFERSYFQALALLIVGILVS